MRSSLPNLDHKKASGNIAGRQASGVNWAAAASRPRAGMAGRPAAGARFA